MCEGHWPAIVRGKRRPVNPTSIFQDVSPIFVPTPPSKPRPTTEACPSSRSILHHEETKRLISMRSIAFHFFPYCINDCVLVHSVEFGHPSYIPRFLLKIFENLTYIGVRLPPLPSNRVRFQKSLSMIQEAISFLNTMEKTQKMRIYIL